MFDVISFGSATEDVFIHVPEKYSLNGKFSFKPGSKVEIIDMKYFTGGGATNTATAFSRLGLKASILCAVGGDDAGKSITKKLEVEKVDTSLVIKVKGKNTAYSAILTGFGRDRVVLVYSGTTASLNNTKINWKKINAKWFYISSLHSKPKFLQEIVNRAKKIGAKIAFNPGQAELKLGVKKLAEIFGKIDVLILNREEALKLTGSADIHRNLKKLQEIAEITVITDGKHGAYASEKDYSYYAKTFKIEPLDVTGAGDAFGSGFVSAIIKRKSIEEALIYGTSNSNSVIKYLGTKNVLLTESQLKSFAKKYIKNKKYVKKQKL